MVLVKIDRAQDRKREQELKLVTTRFYQGSFLQTTFPEGEKQDCMKFTDRKT
jgi:hypothetical protein